MDDPPDWKDKAKDFSKISNPARLLEVVKKEFPGWIVYEAVQGSVDLVKMNMEWAMMCRNYGCEPQKILIVTDTYLRERGRGVPSTHKLIHAACDYLSKVGYLVRDAELLDICAVCKELIVARKWVEKGGLVFSGKCQGCYPFDPRKKVDSEEKKVGDEKSDLEEKKE